VIIGNPPYNARQQNENDNNKNRVYPLIEARVRETYTKDSSATNKNALGDPYIKFLRWASDRLESRDGIVCMITNNGFVHKYMYDGIRKHLSKDYSTIYHVDLHGDRRRGEELTGTTHSSSGLYGAGSPDARSTRSFANLSSQDSDVVMWTYSFKGSFDRRLFDDERPM
jgi:predicted helicase